MNFKIYSQSYPRGDVFTQLDLAMKKLERLMKEVGATTGDSTIKDKLQNTEFQVIMELDLGIFSPNVHNGLSCF